MAQLVGLQIYQINQLDSTPLASTQKIAFPFAGIIVRPFNAPGTTGVALSTGQIVYSSVQVISSGDQYKVIETVSAITALS